MESFIPAAIYHNIFLYFITLLVVIKIVPIGNENILTPETKNVGLTKTLFLGLVLILFFGLRDTEDPGGFFADSRGYAYFYTQVTNGATLPVYDSLTILSESKDVGFYLVRDFMASNDFDVTIWFIVVSIIYVVPFIIAANRFFPEHQYLAFLFMLCNFVFYSGAVNGLRNGDAIALFVGGTALLLTKYRPVLVGIALIIFSYLFHNSAIILVLSLFSAIILVRKINIAIIIWIVSIISSLLFGNSLAEVATSLGFDERAEEYLMSGKDLNNMQASFSHIGFRWDFLLYSSIPIILGWYVSARKQINDKIYQIILNTYIISNSIWIIFMYASYTNRFAGLSWGLYAIVLLYPLIKLKIFPNYQKLFVVLGLCFMLLCSYIL